MIEYLDRAHHLVAKDFAQHDLHGWHDVIQITRFLRIKYYASMASADLLNKKRKNVLSVALSIIEDTYFAARVFEEEALDFLPLQDKQQKIEKMLLMTRPLGYLMRFFIQEANRATLCYQERVAANLTKSSSRRMPLISLGAENLIYEGERRVQLYESVYFLDDKLKRIPLPKTILFVLSEECGVLPEVIADAILFVLTRDQPPSPALFPLPWMRPSAPPYVS